MGGGEVICDQMTQFDSDAHDIVQLCSINYSKVFLGDL